MIIGKNCAAVFLLFNFSKIEFYTSRELKQCCCLFFTGNSQNLIPVVNDALVMAILNVNNNIKYYLGSKQDALLLFPQLPARTGTRVLTYLY